MRYIPYDLTNPDSVEQAENDVRDHAAACEKGEVTFTPIQFVEMLDTARHDGENQFVSLALGIQSALSNLHSDVRQVRAQVSEELVFVYQRLLHELTENARRQAIDRPRGNLVSYRDLMIPPENVGSPPAQAKNAAFYVKDPKTREPDLPPPPADSPKDKK